MIVILALPLASTAHAQSEDWSVSGSIVYNDDDPDRKLDDGVSGIKLGVGWNFNHWLTLEGALIYSNTDGYYRDPPGPYYYADDEQIDVGANLLAYYDREAVFAPYALLGIGYQKANLNFGGKDQNPTASLGAGFKWKMGQSRFSLLGEFSSRWTFDGSDRTFNDYTAAIGVQYSFGSKRRTPQPSDKPADTDGDGVLDMWDACPGTPAGVDVTARGCEIKNIDNDRDNDRVPDSSDECPNTPAGAPVGPTGCSLDADMDGVQTGQDRCPGTRPGVRVDMYGCEINADQDGDGILNENDRCPNTIRGARIDVYGCEIKDVIQLPGVNFTTGSDLLLPGTEQLLKDAARTLNNYPNLMIEVAGHTDNVGSVNMNLGLSDRRAKTVLDHLVEYGVDPARLTFKGYGDILPIADNSTAEGRAQNRRVELRIVGE